MVVISHDRNFCDKIPFTHVGTVRNGRLYVEERDVNENDWIIDGVLSTPEMATVGTNINGSEEDHNRGSMKPEKRELDPKLRKKAFNAPKRIAKLESLTAEAETKIAALDEEMLAHGNEPVTLMDLTKQKEQHKSKIAEYMEEWQELEALLAMIETGSSKR